MKAYHFLKEDMCGDYGSELAWKISEERSVAGELRMCQWGYHASPSWYDALFYARGNVACIVELSGEIKWDTDKYVARTRKLIDARNAEQVLRAWACDCAERALRKIKVTDERSWNAIKVARLYNEGKATKDELALAWAATWAATWVAAGDAARAAARAATWDTAWAAARAATWVAARAAARAAVRDAAWDDAAWVAAWNDARDTEIKWQRRRLNWYMNKLFKVKIDGHKAREQN